ncbi:MAG: tRNA lysidine(34) synthetase TilS [Kofleriaceae bacterium]
MANAIFEVRRAVFDALGPLGPDAVGVACSGGADSIALVDAAAAALGAARVALLHVDHGLTEGSARVAAEVLTWARARGLRAAARRVQLDADASLERAARRARYAALEELAAELGLGAIATAHTARDQAETVLLRVLRGTGPGGLAGIPARRGRFVRPLLDVERSVVEAYVAARGLPTWEDPMNLDLRFSRARVRHELLPILRRENPAIDGALVRLARHAAEWAEVIDRDAEPLSRELRVAPLAAAPAAIRKRALALALIRAGLGFDAEHLEQGDRLIAAPARGTQEVALPGGALVREYDRLWLRAGRAGEAPPAPPRPHAQEPAWADDPRYQRRTPRPGDRMRPQRLAGRSRKLSDLFSDAKVPRRLRTSACVISRRDDGAIVWVQYLGPAWRLDEVTQPDGTGPRT